MAKPPLLECATCGKSWRKKQPEDASLCPFCGSNAVRPARMTDTATGQQGGCVGKLVVVLGMIIAGVAGYFYWFHLRAPAMPPPPSPNATAPPPPPQVEQPQFTLPQQPEPEPAPEPAPEPEPVVEETKPPAPKIADTTPSREWYQLAVNYHAAGRDDLARAELQKVIEAGEPEWVEKAQALMQELGAAP